MRHVLMIEVPPKLWQPNITSRYRTPELDDDGVSDIISYTQYGKCVYKPKLDWSPGHLRIT